MANPEKQLEQLVEAVQTSSKYRTVSVDVIRRIGAVELGKRPRLKEAVKATKNKLHQTGGAYQDANMRYDAWLNQLKQAGSQEDFTDSCKHIMGFHTSTRERLPILGEFYKMIFAELPPISTVLDIACGLNSLCIPWIPLETGARYYAYDIYQNMAAFITDFLQLIQVDGYARAQDVALSCPSECVDVAFLLKTMPCLEQVDKIAGKYVLENVNARHLVVSYPVHSLGGRNKGMIETYESHFRALVAGKDWEIKRLLFHTELVFIVTKGRGLDD